MKLPPILSIVLTLSSGSLAWFGFGKQRLVHHEPTRNTEGDAFEVQWFSQMLDHYDPASTRTWKQDSRLKIAHNNTLRENWNRQQITSRTTDSTKKVAWIADDASLESYLAKKFGAKIFFLEHRFYGKSQPTYRYRLLHRGDATIPQYTPIDQVDPLWRLVRRFPGILDARQVSPSGLRSCAPLFAEIDFKDFYIVVENSARKHSPNCVAVLSQAYKSLHSMLADKASWEELENMFNVCGSYFEENTMINDIFNFYEGIIDIVTEVVFNNDTYSLTIEKARSVLEDEEKGEPLTRLAQINELLLKSTTLPLIS
ncbi:putative serine protease F56F10.1 [Nasonia vitripennis]|uniref:Uncharacterized protein n=1 Tax=Nasonia vitripennis TaxID=7425 RepID=A0A7M7IMZ8_NASVI|nr:putative serine protease F56F10.1 [Nasonia vitripennis]